MIDAYSLFADGGPVDDLLAPRVVASDTEPRHSFFDWLGDSLALQGQMELPFRIIDISPVGGAPVGLGRRPAPDPRRLRRDTDFPRHELGFVYHTTDSSNLNEIARTGIKPRSPSFRGEQEAWPDGSVERRSYWSETPGGVGPFRPSPESSILIRAARDDKFRNERGTPDVITRRLVPPKDLEYLAVRGIWEPVQVVLKKYGFPLTAGGVAAAISLGVLPPDAAEAVTPSYRTGQTFAFGGPVLPQPHEIF